MSKYRVVWEDPQSDAEGVIYTDDYEIVTRECDLMKSFGLSARVEMQAWVAAP